MPSVSEPVGSSERARAAEVGQSDSEKAIRITWCPLEAWWGVMQGFEPSWDMASSTEGHTRQGSAGE